MPFDSSLPRKSPYIIFAERLEKLADMVEKDVDYVPNMRTWGVDMKNCCLAGYAAMSGQFPEFFMIRGDAPHYAGCAAFVACDLYFGCYEEFTPHQFCESKEFLVGRLRFKAEFFRDYVSTIPEKKTVLTSLRAFLSFA